jgi:cell division protease FtsH
MRVAAAARGAPPPAAARRPPPRRPRIRAAGPPLPPIRARNDDEDDGFFDDGDGDGFWGGDEGAPPATAAEPAVAEAEAAPAPAPRRKKKTKSAARKVAAAAEAAPAGAPPPPPARVRTPLAYSDADTAKLAHALDEWAAADAGAYAQPRAAGQPWRSMTPRDALGAGWRELQRRLDHESLVPPMGGAHISYARLLELLASRCVHRLTILGGGRAALVEVPVEGYAVDYSSAGYDALERGMLRGRGLPPWSTEVTRFWCDLPGDVWEAGTLVRLVKDNAAPVIGADGTVRPKDMSLADTAPTTDLVVAPPYKAFAFAASLKGSAIPIAALLGIRLATGIIGALRRAMGKGPADPEVDDLLGELGRSPAMQFNVPLPGGGAADTGVRYTDVAGVDHVLARVREVVSMLLGGDARYAAIGAAPPRGLLFAGPPGTGKTLLARAMAGEAGVPFYACSGSDFVEMYAGVAAARVRDLFKLARKTAPSIIFIDEIDAIARSRSLNSGSDPGSVEREQGLLQMLVEMDGFSREDRVLVIGATNLIDTLDPAVLRPGRFTFTLRMDAPRAESRLKILKVHAAGKPIDRSPSTDRPGGDGLLWRVAKKTGGWSGAELANLMNEAAILMVRHDKDEIDWPILVEAIDKREMLDAPSRMPAGEALRRLATVHAARAVAARLVPGFPRVDAVGVDGRGAMAARIKFDAVDYRTDGDAVIASAFGGGDPDRARPPPMLPGVALPLSPYEVACAALVPLLVPRAAELILFGPDGATLATAREVAAAGDYAHWLATTSAMHPGVRSTTRATALITDAGDDPLTAARSAAGAAAGAALQAAAWARARALVRAWRPAVDAIAGALLASPELAIDGDELARLMEAHPPPRVAARVPGGAAAGAAAFRRSAGAGKPGAAIFGSTPPSPLADAFAGDGVDLASPAAATALAAVAGALGSADLTAAGLPAAARARLLDALRDPVEAARLAAQRLYSTTDDAPFPPPPAGGGEDKGAGLAAWAPALGGPPFMRGRG